jgi:hypothetical protein
VLRIKRGDTRPGATITCKIDGVLADWTQFSEVRLLGAIDGTLVIDRLVEPTVPGYVDVDFLSTDTAIAGRMQVEVQAIWTDGINKTTFPDDGFMEVDIIPDLGG